MAPNPPIWVTPIKRRKHFMERFRRDPSTISVTSLSFFDPFEGPLTVAMLTRREIFVYSEARDWFVKVSRDRKGNLRIN